MNFLYNTIYIIYYQYWINFSRYYLKIQANYKCGLHSHNQKQWFNKQGKIKTR